MRLAREPRDVAPESREAPLEDERPEAEEARHRELASDPELGRELGLGALEERRRDREATHEELADAPREQRLAARGRLVVGLREGADPIENALERTPSTAARPSAADA